MNEKTVMDLHRTRVRLAERPDDATGHRRRAGLLRAGDDLPGARTSLGRALACASDPDAMLELADLLCLRGDLAGAAALAEAAAALAPLHAGAYRFAASVRSDLSQWDAAGRLGRRAVALDPADGETWRGLGTSPGGTDEADVHLLRALAICPEDRLARFELAAELDRLGVGDLGIEHRRLAIGTGDWRDLPVIINSRDRLTPLRQLLAWLQGAGHRNVIILDNQSTYPPLLRFYDQLAGIRLVRIDDNLGHTALWRTDLLDRFSVDTPFVYTDPDIVPDENCPPDAVGHLCRVLLRHGRPVKVGFAIRIDDLPDRYRHKDAVTRWEAQFWNEARQLRPGQYWAPIDTTFALYSARAAYDVPGIRTGPPYVARHLPWYADSERPDEEERYYRAHAAPSVTTWTGEQLSDDLTEKIRRLRSEA